MLFPSFMPQHFSTPIYSPLNHIINQFSQLFNTLQADTHSKRTGMAESSDDDSQISGASDNDGQVVPGDHPRLAFLIRYVSGNVLYNLKKPSLRVVIAELPGPDDIVTGLDDPEPICEHEDLGEVRILQLSDEDGQGQYFTAQSGKMGYPDFKKMVSSGI